MSIRDQIVQHSNRTSDRVISVPEWGIDEMHLRRLSLADYEAIQSRIKDQPAEVRARETARLLRSHCVDADGNPLFDFPDAVSVLVKAETKVVNRIALMISGDRPLLNTVAPRSGEPSEEDAVKNG